MSERVVLAGAGPGDARHVTLEVAAALREADVVFAEASVGAPVLALAERAETIVVAESSSPVEVALLLAERARKGAAVVRLFSGDPLLFSRGDVEARELTRLGVRAAVLPGVSVLTAVAACAGIPLTRTGDASPSVAFARVTQAHQSLLAWDELAGAADVLAMVVDTDVLTDVARTLVFHGLVPSTPATVVEEAALPTQRVHSVTLDEVSRGGVRPEARAVVFVVGDRVRPEPSLGGFVSRPLFGRRIVVTRAEDQAGAFVSKLRELGADAASVPTIAFEAPSNPALLERALACLFEYSWIVFTSRNGVRRFFAALLASGRDVRAVGSAKLAVVGPSTARELEAYSLRADLVARDSRAEGLASALNEALGSAKAKILLARAEVGREVLPEALRTRGHDVDVVPVYRTRAAHGLDAVRLANVVEAAHVVTFTSPSTASGFVEAVTTARAVAWSKTRIFASIGPVTTAAMEALDLHVSVTADVSTEDGLIEALGATLPR